MEEILVSVRCTTFNHEPYIRRALDSFLMQKTDFPYEIVVHDDASTDGTQEILRDYQKRYPDRIRLILQKENQYSQGRGPAGFINPELRGRYVALCEGDDYWTDDRKLQLQADYLNAHPECWLTAHQAVRVNGDGDYVRPYSQDPNKEDYDMDLRETAEDLSRFPTASMMFRRSFFQRFSGLLEQIPNFDYVYKLLLAGTGPVHVFARSMSAYRQAARGSWTERMEQDSRKYLAHLETALSACEAIRDALGEDCRPVMDRQVLSRRAQVAELQGNLKALKQPELLPWYRALPLKSRVSLHLRAWFPGLYSHWKGNH